MAASSSSGGDSKAPSTEQKTSALTQLEKDAAEHNQKHGIKNDGRSLIEIAEQDDPSISKLHHAKALSGADDLGEEQSSSAAVKGDVQQVPETALHPKSDFINSGGKVGSLGGVNAEEATRSETNAGNPRHRTPP